MRQILMVHPGGKVTSASAPLDFNAGALRRLVEKERQVHNEDGKSEERRRRAEELLR